jgi:hypothetical protein
MITARAGDEKEPILLLGLSQGNIERLQLGQPIKATSRTHGGIPEGWIIYLVAGQDEKAIWDELKEAGVVGPTTEVRIHPR